MNKNTKNTSIVACNCCEYPTPRPFLDVPCFSTGHMLHVVRCPKCGLVYLSPRPNPELGQQYFEAAYRGEGTFDDHPYYRDHQMKFKKFSRHFSAIESLNPPIQRLLDIGAGQGHFLKTTLDSGWQADGMEVSPAAREAADKLFNIKLLSKIPPPEDGHYGVVTLWDVIEHVANPKALIRQAIELLVPGGYLMVQTGNVDSREAHLDLRRWNLWHVTHSYYFSSLTLSQLIDHVGLVEIRPLSIPATPIVPPLQKRSSVASKLVSLLRHPLPTIKMQLFGLKRRLVTRRFPGVEHDYLITVVARRPNE